MKVTIKCHDCKQRYTSELDDSGVSPTLEPLLCQFCYSDALTVDPLDWLDRNPRVKLLAKYGVYFMIGFAAAALFFEAMSRCGG